MLQLNTYQNVIINDMLNSNIRNEFPFLIVYVKNICAQNVTFVDILPNMMCFCTTFCMNEHNTDDFQVGICHWPKSRNRMRNDENSGIPFYI